MARILEDFFLFPRVGKIEEKVLELLAPPPTPTNLFTTPA